MQGGQGNIIFLTLVEPVLSRVFGIRWGPSLKLDLPEPPSESNWL